MDIFNEICLQLDLGEILVEPTQLKGGFMHKMYIIYYSSYGRLEWLEYNVKRALGIDCGEDEIETGVSEVRETMEHIVYYHSVKDKILKCLNLL